MAVEYGFNAEVREQSGKSAARRMRHDKKIPAIIYGAHQEPVMLALSHNEVEKKIANEVYFSSILTINVEGSKPEQAVLKSMQRHPSKRKILHLDFQRVSADEQIKIGVPIHFLNEDVCVGVKAGGSITHVMTEVEVSCLPSQLPEYIELDLAELGVGESIHLTQLPLAEGVEIVALSHGEEHDHDQVVVAVQAARVEVEASADEQDGADSSEAADGESGED